MEDFQKVRVLLVDDELDARKNLRYLLGSYEQTVEIIGEAENAINARSLCEQHEVDLIFLDVAMPRESGFEFLKSIPDYQGEVIFITSYNQHAEKAFKYFALGYITKPIDRIEFDEVLNRTIDIIKLRKKNDAFQYFIDHIRSEGSGSKNLIVPTSEGYQVIEKSTIRFIEAQRNYSKVVSDSGSLLVSRNLAVVAGMIEESYFMRIHKSYIVNTKRIRKVTFEGTVLLESGEEVRFSHKNKDALLKKLADV